jgi:hypothetical protein
MTHRLLVSFEVAELVRGISSPDVYNGSVPVFIEIIDCASRGLFTRLTDVGPVRVVDLRSETAGLGLSRRISQATCSCLGYVDVRNGRHSAGSVTSVTSVFCILLWGIN